MFAFAMFISLCVDVMVKSVGDSTQPCGTPFLNWRCVDVLFLNVVYVLRPLM